MELDEIPMIISVDDHVVEPPHVWERWLPAQYRDRGPKIVRRGIGAIDYVGTANYVEHFDDSSPTKVDCWMYEDLVYTHKRMVAAAGYPKEEMTLTPITYDMYAESQIGWIPYALQRVDQVREDNQGWAKTKHIPEPSSTYYYQSMFGCFINDPYGLDSLDEIGERNVTCETDYPHSDSSWPDTKAIVTKLVTGLTPQQTERILRTNAIELLRLDFK